MTREQTAESGPPVLRAAVGFSVFSPSAVMTGGVPSRGCSSGYVPREGTCAAELPPSFGGIRHEEEVDLGG